MMYLIEPTKQLQGEVRIPGSKSGTARGIVLGTLAKGETRIYNPMPGIDSYSIIDCCRTLGAKIDCSGDDEWIIEGIGMDLRSPSAVLDVGNSGTGYYILTTVASMINGKSIITGDYQICYRPIAPLLKAIRELGGKAISTRDNELAPLVIEGPIEGGHTVHFPGVNVQWLIGLLISCPSLQGDTRILVENLAGLLPTIVSRCQIIRIPPLSAQQVAQIIKSRTRVAPDEALVFARLSFRGIFCVLL